MGYFLPCIVKEFLLSGARAVTFPFSPLLNISLFNLFTSCCRAQRTEGSTAAETQWFPAMRVKKKFFENNAIQLQLL